VPLLVDYSVTQNSAKMHHNIFTQEKKRKNFEEGADTSFAVTPQTLSLPPQLHLNIRTGYSYVAGCV